MILRVVRGRIRPGEREDVLAAMRDDYGPVVAATPGLLRFVLGIRTDDGDGDRIVAISTWESLEVVHEAYSGNLATARTIDGPTRGAIYDSVSYYELEAHRIAAGASRPRLLRVTAGMVSRGLDADIQQELRVRLPDLPPEAVEAYVGRRVIGTSVEIAFMSTWTMPPGEPLEQPIWPDISERYDTFALELYDIALIGKGASASKAS